MRNITWELKKLYDNKFMRQFLFVLLVITAGVVIGKFSATQPENAIKLLFVEIVILLVLLLLYRGQIKVVSLQKGLLYLTIIAGFIGPAFLVIPIGPIHIFPYRFLLLLLWLIFAMEALFQGRINISHLKVKPYLQFLGFWLVYAVLSLAWAASKTDAIRYIIFLFMATSVIFFVVYHFSNIKDLKRFYHLWLVVLGGLLLVGMWENLTGQHLPISGFSEERLRNLAPYVIVQVKNIPTGVFKNPNDYATFLALSVPFVLALIRYRRHPFTLSVGLILLLISLYLLLVTFSRANYLAVVLELFFFFTFLYKLSTKIKTATLGGLVISALVMALPETTQRLAGTVSEQIQSLFSFWSLPYESIGVRINLIKNALVFLGRTAGFGVGAGNAEYWMENFQIYDTRGILNPHNWWIEILVDYGIFVFMGYILCYLGLIVKLYRIHRRLGDRTEKMICEALLVALVGFFLASISSSSIMALIPQWFLFAFALAFVNYYRIKQTEGAT